MNALESEFLEFQATPDDEFQLIWTKISPCALITCGTKYLNKLIYTLLIYIGQPRFKRLAEFAKFLLLIQ